jgi:hypothetical protein
MIKVNKAINLEQLDKELNSKGLIASLDDAGNILEIGLADENAATVAELQKAVDNHLAVFHEPTIAEQLAKAGISIADLKAELGL